jgi:hypothetical protein
VQQNLAIQHHSAVSPKRKPVTCPRAMQQEKDVHAPAQARLPSCTTVVQYDVYSIKDQMKKEDISRETRTKRHIYS